MADLHTTLVHFDLEPGKPVQVSPLVQRLTADNASIFTGPGTNTYIVGKEQFTVIDPGPNEQAHIDAIMAATGGRIDKILATHTHEDHSPAAVPLAELTGAEILGLRADSSYEYIDQTFLPESDVVEDQVIEADGCHLRCILTPGHLRQHVCFLLEEENLLFTGDHIMQGATVVIVPIHGGSMQDYFHSLQKLKGRGIERLAPAHGHVLQQAEQVIDELYAHRVARENAILAVLGEKKKGTVEELAPLVYPELQGEITKGALAILWAHLQKLVDDGRATRTHEKHWIVGEEIWEIIE